MTKDTCNSEVGLEFLAPGMAKQYDGYQSALQELIDNSVSAFVSSEAYFDNPKDSISIDITIRRHKNVVQTVVADAGPGISKSDLQNEVFRTGNKSVSDGILNNVGWGLKASVSWFEHSLKRVDGDLDNHAFKIYTKQKGRNVYLVNGPISGELPIEITDVNQWNTGLSDQAIVTEADHGTRVHVTCGREQFDENVWPSAQQLSKKLQALREILGVKFRRLLSVSSHNRLLIHYEDIPSESAGCMEVVPIQPQYQNPDQGTQYESHQFSVADGDGNEFEIEYEKGTLDFEAMRESLIADHPDLFTAGGNFRTRYRPSQANQGIDVYANGRILMTSVFSELFGLTRNNQYNYFGGELRIIPKESEVTVPTDNRKTRIDTTSVLWDKIRERLSEERFQPVGKQYDSAAPDHVDQVESLLKNKKRDINVDYNLSGPQRNATIYGLHNADSRFLRDHVEMLLEDEGITDNLVDATITSPPYSDIKDYGSAKDDQIGPDQAYDSYLDDLRDVFQQVYDITAEDGVLWVVSNTFRKQSNFFNLPADIATTLQNLSEERLCPNCSSADLDVPLMNHTNGSEYACVNCGFESTKSDSWQLKEIVIWDKKRALPYSGQGKLRNVFEYAMLFTKSEEYVFNLDKIRIADPSQFKEWWVEYPERYHPRGIVPDNVWEIVTPTQGWSGLESLSHPAPFPPKLVERMLQLTTEEDDVVLDPFAGSGMVLAVADAMDRRSFGFELNSDYCDNFEALRNEIDESSDVSERSFSTENQNQLVDLIGGLRQMKQIHILFNELAKEQQAPTVSDLDILAAFHECISIDYKVNDPSNFSESQLFLLVDGGVSAQRVDQLQSMTDEILNRQPATNFGLSTFFEIMPIFEFLNRDTFSVLSSKELFLYENEHYSYTDRIEISEYLCRLESQETSKGRFPPIISTIGLDVLNPRKNSPGRQSELDDLIDIVKNRDKQMMMIE